MSVPEPGPFRITLLVRVMPLTIAAPSGLVLQTWTVVSSARTMPPEPGTRLTTQLLARVSKGFKFTEHLVPGARDWAAASAGFPSWSLTTVLEPPALAAAEAATLLLTTALVETSKLPL